MPKVDEELLKQLFKLACKGLSETKPEKKEILKKIVRRMTETSRAHGTGYYQTTVDYITDAALNMIRGGLGSGPYDRHGFHDFCDKHLRHEHVVPCAVQYELVRKEHYSTIDDLRIFFEKYGYRACITKEEDAKLIPALMPENWSPEDPFARYNHAGITLRHFDLRFAN